MRKDLFESIKSKLKCKGNGNSSCVVSYTNTQYRKNNKPPFIRGSNARQSPIHRWYCISEMLPVNFVRALLNKSSCNVLDPFVGVGTVLVEAKLAGIVGVGIDVNPFMCFASKVKSRDYNIDDVKATLENIYEGDKTDSIQPPPIPNLEAYYSPQILEKLVSLEAKIRNINEPTLKDLFMLCFVRVATQSANIKRGPAPRFGAVKKDYPVLEDFKKYVEIIIDDLNNISESYGLVEVYNGDARNLDLHKEFDLIITSPPYCNNIDYVRHSQLELYWLGYASSFKDLRRIRENSVTSCEAMAYWDKEDTSFFKEVSQIANKLKSRTGRAYDRVVTQYFSGMKRHFESVKRLLKPEAKAVYVIGDSWIKGVYIPTHKLIAKIAKSVGFGNVKLELMRRRLKHKGRFFLGEYVVTLSL